MLEAVKQTINEIYEKYQQEMWQDLGTSGDVPAHIFECLVQVMSCQRDTYKQLFEVPGYLPKEYSKILNRIFTVYGYTLAEIYSVPQLETMLTFSRLLAAELGNVNTPFLVQVKASVDGGKEESFYFVEPYKTTLSESGNIWPDFSNWVRACRVPVKTELVMHTKRVPVTMKLIEDLLKKICDDDNWQIEEVDPVEHYQQQVFQWDKAFGPFFEYAYGTQGPFSEANNASC